MKVTGADTTPGYLADKIPSTSDVAASVGTPGGDEDLLLTVVGITESSGPTSLPIGPISNGQFLAAVGGSVIGVPPPGGGGDQTRVSITDTTPGYLAGKIPSTSNVAASIGTPGGDEDLLLAVVGITESSGPTSLPIGAIPPDTILVHDGLSGEIVGASPAVFGLPVPPENEPRMQQYNAAPNVLPGDNSLVTLVTGNFTCPVIPGGPAASGPLFLSWKLFGTLQGTLGDAGLDSAVVANVTVNGVDYNGITQESAALIYPSVTGGLFRQWYMSGSIIVPAPIPVARGAAFTVALKARFGAQPGLSAAVQTSVQGLLQVISGLPPLP